MKMPFKYLVIITTLLILDCYGCTDAADKNTPAPDQPNENCVEICDQQTEYKCIQDTIAQCETDSEGCAVWKTIKKCDTGDICDPKSYQCVKDCEERCDHNAMIKCTPEGIDQCEPDADGCALHHTEACPSGEHCDETLLQCVPTTECSEICDTSSIKRCSENGVETCTSNAQGCAEWHLTETCGNDQYCDETSFSCIDGCKSICSAGEIKCTDEGIAECTDTNNAGCFKWIITIPCSDGQACDLETKTCKCGDNCTESQQRCENNIIQTCSKNSQGCMTWTDTAPCGSGQTCNSAQTACEYTCSNDCEPFSIILIPDPQNYAKSPKGENNTYTKETKWIHDNISKENIRAAIHLGDITDNNTINHWEVAKYAHQYLDQANIPYTISTGNHDYKPDAGQGSDRANTHFEEYFGASHFKDKSWYHASPYSGNSYITFDVGNIKFLVLALEFAARKDVICWADELIKKYPDHHVIIETHNYLRDGSGQPGREDEYSLGAYLPDASFGASGWDLFHELVARHNNVFLAVGGHEFDTEFRQKKGFNANTVSEMLVNYQLEYPCHLSSPSQCTDHCKHATDAGNGWLRQLIFDPKTNKIKAKTFTVLNASDFAGNQPEFYCSEHFQGSEQLKTYEADINSKDHQFEFDADFTTPIQYQYNDNHFIGFGTRDINSVSTGNQLNPDIAMHRTTGSIVTVWEDDSSQEDGKKPSHTTGGQIYNENHDIMGRVFYPGGCQKAAQFTINTDTEGDQITPKVAMDNKGNFVVVWADDTDNNGYYEIYMRGFDENGNERIKTTTVNSRSDGQQINPAIAMAEDGRFVVAWEDYAEGSNYSQIYVRGFNANGEQTFADRNLEAAEGDRKKPDIGIANDGSFVVTWEDDTDMNGVFQVHAKGFKADGTDRTETFVVNSIDDGQQQTPAIAMNSDGTFFITYIDNSDLGTVYRIKAHGYHSDCTEMTKDMVISDNDDAIEPDVSIDKQGNAIFTWTVQNVQNAMGEWGWICATAECFNDIRYRTYKNNALGNIETVNPIQDGHQDQPAIACTDDGKFTVLYHDDNDNNNYYEILGHGYNGN